MTGCFLLLWFCTAGAVEVTNNTNSNSNDVTGSGNSATNSYNTNQTIYNGKQNAGKSRRYGVCISADSVLAGYPYYQRTGQNIYAYQQLMDRFVDMSEKNHAAISADMKTIIKKLDAINTKLTKLGARIAKIETKLQPKQQ